jgi:hypothetical protein
MSSTLLDISSETTFVDRRRQETSPSPIARERRQFANSYDDLSIEGQDLARAIDQYKLMHRRRFITFDEMLSVLHELGYRRD